jgi:bifunctional DNA-binding transcriptional regulator/antitoxin component of YhaV-PrlF toxin-antitoxin module
MVDSKFIGKVKITKQGQLTLPLEARNDLGISVEEEVYWYELNGALVVTKELMNQKDLDSMMKKSVK